MADDEILIEGARQNNLKGLRLRLPLHELIVVTGVSGSGKSSLAFDTVYAEGQRRYVETFSPYARQFLERMDKPRVERIEGIPPAIAIDQTNPVRTSRSTVGTMTEINDHLKLLFARAAQLYCRGCGRRVMPETPDSIFEGVMQRAGGGVTALLVAFPVTVPANFGKEEVRGWLDKQGYGRIHRERGTTLEVIQDRLRLDAGARGRLVEDLETALRFGRGRVLVYPLNEARRPAPEPWRFSAGLHCPDCDIHYQPPIPSLFSFNSPVGACPTCRGFGRVMGIDDALVIPDQGKSLAGGAVKPWQSRSYGECQDDLMRFARRRGIPTRVPWRDLTADQRQWVLEGEGDWDEGVWYGVRRFFQWLESKSYKMHIRVLLSKYRAYTPCPDCGGSRLKADALWWRLGGRDDADGILPPVGRFAPPAPGIPAERFRALPGLTLHDVVCLPLTRCRDFFDRLHLPAPLDEASEQLLKEIRTRLAYLVEVGLGYLTLDRQSRTLSGGEVQRINLTTALGTSLVNALFVLDEPSIGLHPRDMQRVVNVLKRLRDAGNSLLVVEHDPQVMLAADRVLDLGPGPGERGGELVYFGPPAELLDHPTSVTARYLRGEDTVGGRVARPNPPTASTPRLRILGAAEHNLKDIDVTVPLQRLVCVTGVSGSGKSTLIRDILYNGLRRLKGRAAETPGRHRALHGHERIDQVVLVDQSPIGKTARSNPASYVGALDAVRKAFAGEPLARERGYTAGTFSFNSGNGRCPTCGGNGFEHVEMQFLSDVYLRCPDCDGRRYRPEILEVKLHPPGDPGGPGRSIADVLEMTVSEALAFFAGVPEVARRLAPLQAVGLEYLRLGQPVPTLSGGEAQRLKLAGHLAEAGRRPRRPGGGRGLPPATLFLFDEPTTGLHFDDIARLLRALRQLLQEGHSLVVIEHNLDVIRGADWLIDLGPGGGDAGGQVVFAGTPPEIVGAAGNATGAALRAYLDAVVQRPAPAAPARQRPAPAAADGGSIEIVHAREHNLKNISLSIPRDRLTVITGISGSGKSTVAFDILFGEGQRRYLESLNAYARQFVQPAARPDLDAVLGIPPTVAIEQRTSRGGRKSTVATMTEVYHFLRLLFVRLGTQYCPACDIPIEPQTPAAIAARILRDYPGRRIALAAPLVVARKGYYTDLAKWARTKGFAHLRVDGRDLPTDRWPRLDRFKEHDIDLPLGEVRVTPAAQGAVRDLLRRALAFGNGLAHLIPADARRASPAVLFSTRRACPRCGHSFSELDPRLFSFNSKHGWCERCYGTGLELPGFDEVQSGEEAWWNEWWEGAARPCRACSGQRLRPEALAVRFQGRSISAYTAMTVAQAAQHFRAMGLHGRAAEIARDIRTELDARLAFLDEVGLSYLSLDRAAPTLSGGEAQRIRLAAQLGSNLRGVCYILDEPTIGLHPRDNRLLLDTLARLKDKGNTVLVVEHDEETIRRAEHLIDLGPGAGGNGGRVVAQGTVRDLIASPRSVTGQYLANPLRHPLEDTPAPACGPGGQLQIEGAALHNLRDLDVALPLHRLVCVTGVSGSGKSTLTREVLHDNLQRLLRTKTGRRAPRLQGCRRIAGWEDIDHVLEVDQTPIGKTPRSCPATYVGFWDPIRRLFAQTQEARIRGYGPGRFSFNVKGGRCEACEGQGIKKIEMSFLPDVKVQCEVCGGLRFNQETLTVRFKDRHVGEVLAMSVDEAVEFFSAHTAVHGALRLLQDVGLGYLTLGQQSPSLSGGEAQRIKLVTELAKARPVDAAARPTGPGRRRAKLYVLDEPTVGLHMADVEKLIRVLHRLVAAGNTVVVIEHNLDVIAEAQWIIDLGPEGGNGGGRIVAQGSPQQVAHIKRGSYTAAILAAFLEERGGERRKVG